MQLNNNLSGLQQIYKTTINYYKINGDRHLSIFEDKKPEKDGRIYIRFLLSRKHVVEYAISEDRGSILCGLSLAIGPHYFGAADFWSYENANRFTIEATTDGIEHNLRLLDEFLGYPVKHPHVAP